jgi:hypothetical protein
MSLVWEVSYCTNSFDPDRGKEVFYALSGRQMPGVAEFFTRDNVGLTTDFAGGWVFSFEKLKPGCVFTVNLGAIQASGAPNWGASGRALVEVLEQTFGFSAQIQVTVKRKSETERVFYTEDGGRTWR